MSTLKNVNIIQEIFKKIFLIRISVDEATPYFEFIEECTEVYKKSLSKRNLSTLDPDTFDVDFTMMEKSNTVADTFEEINETVSETDNKSEASLCGFELRTYMPDAYNSESTGYDAILNSSRDGMSSAQDSFTKLVSAITQYNTDIIINRRVADTLIDIEQLITQAYTENLSEDELNTLSTYADEVNALMDQLGLNEHCEFDIQGYLESVVDKMIEEQDNTQKAEVFSEEQLEKFTNLLTSLNENKDILPDSIKEYNYLYDDLDVIENDLPFLLTDESADLSDLLEKLIMEEANLPTEVQDANDEIDEGAVDVIHTFAGKEPASWEEIVYIMGLVSSNKDNLPNDLAVTLENVNLNELHWVIDKKYKLDEFYDALAANDDDRIQDLLHEFETIEPDNYLDLKLAYESENVYEVYDILDEISTLNKNTIMDYGPELSPAINVMQEKVEKCEIPSTTSSSLSTLTDDAAGALAELINCPNMHTVSRLVKDLFDTPSFDPEVTRILNSLPDNIMNLDLNDVTNLLGVNTDLSALFGRLTDMTGLSMLSSLIPTNIQSLLSEFPPGMSSLMSTVSNLTGITGAFEDLAKYANLGQLSTAMQNMLDNALNGISLDSITGILTSGDFSAITNIAGSLGDTVSGLMDMAGGLSFDMLSGLQDLPGALMDNLSGIVDNLGGLLDNFNLTSLASMIPGIGGIVAAVVPGEALKLIDFAKNILTSLADKFSNFGENFGPSTLGGAVPVEFW